MAIHLPALVMALTVVLLAFVSYLVGRARGKFGIHSPATTGHPDFERVYRVQANTNEAALMFLPSLWLFGEYLNPLIAGVLGLVWLVARFWYAFAYGAGRSRAAPFVIGGVITIVLLLGGLFGVVRAMILTS